MTTQQEVTEEATRKGLRWPLDDAHKLSLKEVLERLGGGGELPQAPPDHLAWGGAGSQKVKGETVIDDALVVQRCRAADPNVDQRIQA